ncbi:uncharacterized protein LOC131847928 isoform X2 [Achroia grisella]|uniref:uncharacterized protein LOC131847928 isoform X2 n=1 Tax=Achroia grisella TaxID=688607 RepID=UPI0027D3407F|nr:uncharacterized protein LOC131847928 isoform X2 [Achroia grisella]
MVYDAEAPVEDDKMNMGSYQLEFRSQNGAENDLQEKPQEEDDDCGEIEDYDETDIGSLTTQSQRRNGHEENRFFFGLFNNVGQRPPNTATTRVTQMPGTSYRPQNQHPQGSYPPTRPPYWSGGHFGNNVYRPPQAQDPSDNVKPVHEYSDIQMNYWPGIVGGLVSNIFPASPARPSVGSTTQRPPARPPYINFEQSTRRPRQRGINNDNNIIRSFFDLFF